VSSNRWLPILSQIVVLCGACGGARDAPAFVARDSAGIEIVESSRPAWGDSAGWTVAASPVLDMGVAAGDPAYEFQTILGLTRLPNGNILVANRGTRELRFYSPSGEHIRSVGRDGEGPGEFRNFFGAYRYGSDSLIVWDYRLFRWSVFDTAGEFARMAQPTRPVMNPRSLGPLDDGTLILADTWIDPAEERRINHQKILHFQAGGGPGDSLGSYRSSETFSSTEGPPVGMRRIFGAELVRASIGDGYLVGSGEDYEVLDYGSDGRLRRRVRWQGEDRTVSATDVDAYRERFRAAQAGGSEIDQAFLRLLDEVPAADRFPAYSAIIVDADRNVWLAVYPRPLREGPPLWTVLDERGRWLGEVALPEDLEVWEIGADYVLGVLDGYLGVEHVRKYRLIKEE
jgi:hypothetical protein